MNKKEKELLFDDPVQWLKTKLLDKERYVEDENRRFRDKMHDLHYERQERLVEINEHFADKLNEGQRLLESAGIKWEDVVKAVQDG